MKKVICVFALLNVTLGVLYGLSSGPYVEAERSIISSREILSAGSDSGFAIAMSLLSFLVSLSAAVASLARNWKLSTLLAVYAGNHCAYVFLMWLASIDTLLFESIRFGDWLLGLAIVVPWSLFAAGTFLYAFIKLHHRGT